MARELLPVIDLRLLSQAELNTLSLSCPNAFDLRRCDDVVVPKIDRSVFNESAGSRKQTYSRLRLAPRNPSSSSSAAAAATSAPASEATGSDDNDRRENDQIVFHLRKLFAREDPSVSVDPPQTLTLDGDSNTGKEEAKPLVVFADRDREMLNARGMEVDLVALGEKVDPFAGELRRMTEGLKSEEELLGFLNALDGQWGSRRRRRKIVEASGFGDHLPRGWKLLLGLKRKEGVTWVNCRRYVSPNGHQFVSCKEISSYIFSLVGPNAATPISVQNDGTTADKLTAGFPAGFYQKNDATKENHHLSSCTPVSSVSHNHDKQMVLYGGEKQQATEVLRNTLDCGKCNQSFGDKDTYLQHQLSFHQKNAKRRRIGKSIGDGVIVKDGKYECQFCHKTFDERHRYNGHIGAHVRYQGLSAEALPAEISAGRIFNPSPVAAVPCGFQQMAALPEQNEKICSVKSTNELHNIQISEVACTSKLFAENKGHDATESKSKDVLLVINDGYLSKSEHDNGCDLIDKSSKENFQASSVIDNTSNGCANNSVIDNKSNGRTETIYSPFSDVNNMANKSSADATQEDPVDKSSDNQLNDCDMTCSECVDVIEDSNVKDMTSHDGRVNDSVADSKSEEVDKGSNMEDVRPNPFSDTLFFPLRNVIGETCQSVTETGQSNLRAKFLDDHIGGTNRTCCKSEDFGDSNTSMVLKPDSCIDSVDPALTSVDSVTFKAHSEIDIPSSPMVLDFEEYDKEQTVTMGSHVMDLSGNRSCHESEAHADDVFTSTMAENILVQLDTSISESKADFTHCHSQSEKSSAPEGLAIDGLDAANCITPFVNGHTDGIEPNADCLFDIGMKDSKLEELGRTVAMPENSFDSSNIVCEPVAAGVTCGVNDLRISLQVNNDGLPSWMRTANGIPMVGVMSNQKHDNLPGFEELSLGPASSFEFASLTSEGSIAAAEPTNALGNRSCPTVQLAWEISTPKMLNGCELTSVCVWCSAEFSHDGATAEQQSDSLGFICPACKEKISGQLNILNNGSSV
ncbi:uncharacterized protein [Typha latifolia]|uniref:uncharacterized protein isoform X2 n=1 Tax=Typha latifolia TaxID=4733 RepID=UPI003C306CBB